MQNFAKIWEITRSGIISKKSHWNETWFSRGHYNLGSTLSNLGKLQEAELSLRKVIEMKPDLVEAHYNLGSILSNLGKLQEAELSLRKVIEMKPDFIEAHYNLETY